MDRDQLVNDAERQVWDAFAQGRAVDLGEGEPTAAGFDPAGWDPDRTVRAEVIVRLLLNARDAERGYVAKVVLAGARITGRLDLSAGSTGFDLSLERCWLDEEPDFADAVTRGVDLYLCRLPGFCGYGWQPAGSARFDYCHVEGTLALSGARIAGRLALYGATLNGLDGDALDGENLHVDLGLYGTDGFAATGAVNLNGATVGGQLVLQGASLTNPDGYALVAPEITVTQGLLGAGLTAVGTVDLNGAHLGGQLVLSGATLRNPGGDALNAQNLTVDRDLYGDGLDATGAVVLSGARIGGRLDLTDAVLANPDNDALNAQNLTADSDIYWFRLTATGRVDLNGAQIGGALLMSGARLANPGATALSALNLGVDEGISCDEGFTTDGVLDLNGARIGGQLDLSGATLRNPDGDALNAQNLTVNLGLFCQDGFSATGVVDLAGARVGGTVTFAEATLANPGGNALNARGLTVGQSLYCRKLNATGTLDLAGATITSMLALSDSTLADPDGYALFGDNLIVGQDFHCFEGVILEGSLGLPNARFGEADFTTVTFRLPAGKDAGSHLVLDLRAAATPELRLPATPNGVVNLTRAAVGTLDVPQSAWRSPMLLAGLTYTDLDPDPDPPIELRLAWLRADPDGYHPQPYEQLAAYYRTNGHDSEARQVLLAKRRAHRAYAHRYPFLRTPWRQLAAGWFRVPGLIIDGLAGYGYVPARAFAWLVAAIGAGAGLLYPATPNGPTHDHETNAVLLALDSILPTSPLGLRESAGLTGAAYVTSAVLQGFGFALSIAVLPALTRALARGDR
ncbi:hypothetical protein Cs7R123_17290 [Catellatospora sp. TT07R-123]|nr:hypothetical protein Cs7R123_17290 [Catellatospora sp. TT07R-123]